MVSKRDVIRCYELICVSSQEPVSVVLGKELKAKYSAAKRRLVEAEETMERRLVVEAEETMVYAPILQTLQSLLNNDGVVAKVCKYIQKPYFVHLC